MIHELNCTIGYQCSCCNKTFEFEADAYTHDQWCSRCFTANDKLIAQRQMASIKLETYKPDGSKAGIALTEPAPIEIVPDLTQMRIEVKKIIGRWS